MLGTLDIGLNADQQILIDSHSWPRSVHIELETGIKCSHLTTEEQRNEQTKMTKIPYVSSRD